jgi:hypothetical protein
MKKLAVGVLLGLAIILSSCATSTVNPQIVTSTAGDWEGVLLGGTQDASKLNFVIVFSSININGYGIKPLTITNFNFLNNTSCFPVPKGVTGQPVSGTANLTTNNANQVSGQIIITVTSAPPANSTLILTSDALSGTNSNGNMTAGAVTGTWTLTSSSPSCPAVPKSVNATFTLCQNATTCTVI